MADYIKVDLLRGEWCEFRSRLSWKANKVISNAAVHDSPRFDAMEQAALIDIKKWSFSDTVDMESVDMDADQMNAIVAHMLSLYGLDEMEVVAEDDEKKD